jgi:serine/threonine protein kinase
LSRPERKVPGAVVLRRKAMNLVGKRLGPYEPVSLLGAGGMGEVYCARDAKLGRDVAIKVLPPSLTADAVRRASHRQMRAERGGRSFHVNCHLLNR